MEETQEKIYYTMALALVKDLCKKELLDNNAYDYLYRKYQAKTLVKIDNNVLKCMCVEIKEKL